MASVSHQAYTDEEQGVGWLLFASTMLGLVGILSVIDGIVALSKSKFYAAGATFVFGDLRTWGWITLAVGALLIVAAVGTFAGSQFSRWFGILAAGLSAISMFSVGQAYPLWTLLVFGCDVVVIYALATYGGRPAPA
jgi:hypothetical protein